MRTTTGKPTLEVVALGDRNLADAMAAALSAEEVADRYTHGFHTYPAGLNADAARDLMALFPAGSVLDPFCGGGTVLVEARAAGRRAFGSDLNPTAIRVARARTATPDEAVLTKMRSAARKLADVAKKARDLPPEAILKPVEEWYAPHVLWELEALRRGVLAADADVRPLLEAVLSSIPIKTSWRASDTSARRERHHRPAGTTAILFHKKARELGRRIADLRAVVPPGTPDAEIRRCDARDVRLDRPVELVLASPPYPATYDYLPMQHLRRVWFGDGKAGEDAELGPRRDWREGARGARTRWVEGTVAWTKAAAAALAPGGHLVVVIGDGLTPAGEIDASEPTESAAKAAGLIAVARASLSRPDHARDTARWEHVFAFQKPPATGR